MGLAALAVCQNAAMSDDKPTEPTGPDPLTEGAPDPADLVRDPDALKQAHQKYGDYLKKVGLPFEDEEFDDSESRASDQADEADAPTTEDPADEAE